MKYCIRTVMLLLLVCAMMLAVTSCDWFSTSDQAESTDTVDTTMESDTTATTENVTAAEIPTEQLTTAETANNRPIELPVVP